mmetsp:Transcript_103391/g.183665  ORF Transcript_103391/g.183665 Transcript_103391/m.183665 type:complete len:136 (-) Transcript_103391:137-544(-)
MSGEGANLTYCIEDFSDSDCLVSKGEKECYSADLTLGDSPREVDGVKHVPLDACVPEEDGSGWKKVMCGGDACLTNATPSDSSDCASSGSASGAFVSSGNIKHVWGFVMVLIYGHCMYGQPCSPNSIEEDHKPHV